MGLMLSGREGQGVVVNVVHRRRVGVAEPPPDSVQLLFTGYGCPIHYHSVGVAILQQQHDVVWRGADAAVLRQVVKVEQGALLAEVGVLLLQKGRGAGGGRVVPPQTHVRRRRRYHAPSWRQGWGRRDVGKS
jgi:hypothetical protein